MEKGKEKVIEAMKAKIEDTRGNVDKEFVESVEKMSKEMDKDMDNVEKVSEMLDNAVESATPNAYYSPLSQADIDSCDTQTVSLVDFYEEKITDLEEQLAEKEYNRDERGVVDRFLAKFASRKLFVWTLATVAMFYTKIPSDAWVTLSGIYIGTVGVADIVSIAKNNY